MSAPPNLVWQAHRITRADRAQQNGQRPFVVWFTGLSGAGKSTLAGALEERLFAAGRRTYLLDGDNVRHGLNRDLGFSDADRIENIRRIGELAKLLNDAGLIVITAFISPFARDRAMVRSLLEPGDFVEVYLDVSLQVCQARDPKGLYRKAAAGEVRHVTGIDSPYEPPEEPAIRLDTSSMCVESSVDAIIEHCVRAGLLSVPQVR